MFLGGGGRGEKKAETLYTYSHANKILVSSRNVLHMKLSKEASLFQTSRSFINKKLISEHNATKHNKKQ